MNKNFQAYQRLDLFNQKRFTPGDYLVIAGGKLFRKGKQLEKYLTEARKKNPHEVPLVAKVPHRGTFVFIS